MAKNPAVEAAGRTNQRRAPHRADVWQEDQRDELFALYQALWHLKDWIKNDQRAPEPVRQSVERWCNSDPGAASLRVAADVAIGSKPLVLTSSPRAGGSSQLGTDIRLLVGGGLSQTFYIEDRMDPGKPRKKEALKLATECMREWRRFLRAGGLRVPNQRRRT